MTEFSRPWAGTTIGDAGPYTAKDWWDIHQFMQKANGRLTLSTLNNGVYYASAAGKLDGTIPGANTVRISAGAAMVDGAFYYNDANVDVNVPNATAGNVRNDRIVLRKSFDAAIQTVRIVRVAGGQAATPGPGTPTALVKDTTGVTYWEVPLFQVQVSDAGIVTIYADERDYCDAVLTKLNLPAALSFNYTDNVDIISSDFGLGGALIAGKDCITRRDIIMPDHIPGTVFLSAFVKAKYEASTQAVRINLEAEYDEISDGVRVDGTSTILSYTATVSEANWGLNRYIGNLALPNITKGCWLHVSLQRYSGIAPDTYVDDLHVLCFTLSFYTWR